MNFCPNCGTKILQKTNYCGNCGHKLSEKITLHEPDLTTHESNGDFFIPHGKFQTDGIDWGFINEKGEWIVEPQFSSIPSLNDDHELGQAEASFNGKNGLIDKKGNWVIQPMFNQITYRPSFQTGGIVAEVDGKWGVIDGKGDWLIQPMFDYLNHWGYRGFIPASFNKKWGVIDDKGNWVIQPIFDFLNYYGDRGFIHASVNEKWGVIDDKGNWVIQPKFDELRDFGFEDHGLTLASINEKWGVIDDKGNWVIQPQFDDMDNSYELRQFIPASVNDNWGGINWGVIDDKGNWVIQPKFHELEEFGFENHGLILARVKRKWGVIDEKGNWVIQPQFDDMDPVWAEPNNLLRVKLGDKIGYWNPAKRTFLIEVSLNDPDHEFFEWLDNQNEEEEIDENEDFDEDEYEDEDENEHEDDVHNDLTPIDQSDIDLFLGDYICDKVAILGHEEITDVLGRVFGSSQKFFESCYGYFEGDNRTEMRSLFNEDSITFHYLYIPANDSAFSRKFEGGENSEMIMVFSLHGISPGALYCGGRKWNQSVIRFQFNNSDHFEVVKETFARAKIIVNNNKDDWFEIYKPNDNRLLSTKLTKLSFKIEDLINAIQDLFEDQQNK